MLRQFNSPPHEMRWRDSYRNHHHTAIGLFIVRAGGGLSS